MKAASPSSSPWWLGSQQWKGGRRQTLFLNVPVSPGVCPTYWLQLLTRQALEHEKGREAKGRKKYLSVGTSLVSTEISRCLKWIISPVGISAWLFGSMVFAWSVSACCQVRPLLCLLYVAAELAFWGWMDWRGTGWVESGGAGRSQGTSHPTLLWWPQRWLHFLKSSAPPEEPLLTPASYWWSSPWALVTPPLALSSCLRM